MYVVVKLGETTGQAEVAWLFSDASGGLAVHEYNPPPVAQITEVSP